MVLLHDNVHPAPKTFPGTECSQLATGIMQIKLVAELSHPNLTRTEPRCNYIDMFGVPTLPALRPWAAVVPPAR